MNYQNRIVLFLDILGFRKNVLETIYKDKQSGKIRDNEQLVCAIYSTLSEMGQIAGVNNSNKAINVTQFSDSIVISFQDDNPANAKKVFETILKIIVHLIRRSIICRGALSYGKLIHNSQIVFGPALIDAYETESKAAMYPRVIMDKNIYDYARGAIDNKSDEQIESSMISEYMKLDLDGKYYIDFINAAPKIIESETDLINYYRKIREIIINGRKFEQPDLKVKYGWLKMKYNKMLKNLSPNLPTTRTYEYLSNLSRLK